MFKTVGELRKSLDGVSDDTPINPKGSTNNLGVTIEELAFVVNNGQCNIVAEVNAEEDFSISDSDLDKWESIGASSFRY